MAGGRNWAALCIPRQLLCLALAAAGAITSCSKSPTETKVTRTSQPIGAPVSNILPNVIQPRKSAEGQGYVVASQISPNIFAAKPAMIRIKVAATGGYHLNQEFPTLLEAHAREPDIVLVKPQQSRADAIIFEENIAEFVISFTPQSVGNQQLTAILRFAVCTKTVCDPKRETLAWNFNVK